MEFGPAAEASCSVIRVSFRRPHVCGSTADHWSLSCGQPRHRADVTAADVPLLLEF
jgi:hypothetical protein